MDSTRVDQWLWAIRIYKSRSLATDACKGGHVKINGRASKPAATLAVGDRVTAVVNRDVRDLEVVLLIQKRVGAPIAQTCYVDHTPAPPSVEHIGVFGVRDRGSGKPTKRELRELNRLRGRDR